MAERSIGMTTGTGDGDVGGYASNRMVSFFNKAMGNGVLQTGSNFAVTGTGTSSLVISDGALINNGFFFENTSSLTLAMTGVANGVYYLVCRVNDTASAVSVIRSEGTGATTTTIAPRTVRLCLVTTASYSTSTDVLLLGITVTGALFTITDNSVWTWAVGQGITNTVSSAIYQPSISVATTGGTWVTQTSTSGSTFLNTNTTIMNAKYATSSGTGPRIYIYKSGVYLIQWYVKWDANTTGIRRAGIPTATANAGVPAFESASTYNVFTAASINDTATGVPIQQGTAMVSAVVTGAYDAKYFALGYDQNSGTTRTSSESYLRVTKL
jgi:hypothetical protein